MSDPGSDLVTLDPTPSSYFVAKYFWSVGSYEGWLLTAAILGFPRVCIGPGSKEIRPGTDARYSTPGFRWFLTRDLVKAFAETSRMRLFRFR